MDEQETNGLPPLGILVNMASRPVTLRRPAPVHDHHIGGSGPVSTHLRDVVEALRSQHPTRDRVHKGGAR